MDLPRHVKPPPKTWSTQDLFAAATAAGYEKSLRMFQLWAAATTAGHKESLRTFRPKTPTPATWSEAEAKQLLKATGIPGIKLPSLGYSISEIAAFVTATLKTPTSRWAMQKIADREVPDRTNRLYTWPEVQRIIRAYNPLSPKERKARRRK